ncbi:adenosylcobinamide-phosphate synthase CbiB [Paracoccus zhejiangensis]|uniref:Cobalamin biosynthesis protein CobD n=1 Tax=Paracoccus zhejiangensis TaxID=1077935 RepID=A0A2H5EWM0_9RHOB|nr:adenosylcobinamide-phosphate synthase CbiB [Paracoccus zhejiangensis]AUH63708.1 cobalamin biosynthesis protein CobD [Paracoccus zhejiangensis]
MIAALLALIADGLFGWPDRLYHRIGHPVTWLGALIAGLESRLNHGPHRILKGGLATLLTIAAATLPAWALAELAGPLIAGLLAWPLIAARSLNDHLAAVARPLAAGDLAGARRATAMIVGRDVTRADDAALSRASLESLAENASDGVIAPLFWLAVAGLPGVSAYKAINTLDSMIGHRNDRYEQFGKIAARLDDVANLIPARLTALLFALAAGSMKPLRAAFAEAHLHRSPNAGWPEAAMASALGVRLSGPRQYGDRLSDEPWLNGSARDPGAGDITRGLRLYRRALMVLAGMLAAGGLMAAIG